MSLRRSSLRFLAVAALVTAAFGVQTAMTAGPSLPSSIVTSDPARILDTREPLGVPTIAPVAANSSITVQVTGVGGVPANATGVIITITAVDATLPTFITATPTGSPRSTTSILNPGVGSAIANTVTMSLGTGGRIDLYNLAGNVNLIADVSGWLLPEDSGPTIVTESIEFSAYNGMADGPAAPADFGCVNLGAQNVASTLYLDVPLPHGAAVQQVVFRWFDNDTVNMILGVSEINSGAPFSNPSGGNLVGNLGASTGAAGYGGSTLAITAGDATSATVRYQLQVTTLGTAGVGTFHRFCGATVTYLRAVS
jgi:hypothetical protein